MTQWTKDYDPTRLANNASGFFDFDVGDLLDHHDYSFNPPKFLAELEPERAIVLGECGGFDVLVPEHVWYTEQQLALQQAPTATGDAWREKYPNPEAWRARYGLWVEGLRYLASEHGLAGAVYTQLSDIEHEPNGWLTYDRAVSKIGIPDLRALHERLYRPVSFSALLPASRDRLQHWKYLADKPPAEWFAVGFDDSGWPTAPTPFGQPSDGAPSVNTELPGTEVFMRKAFDLKERPSSASLRVYSEGTCTVYLNGQLVKNLTNQNRKKHGHVRVCEAPLHPDALQALHPGHNLIAVHAKHTGAGARYLDVGLYTAGE